MVTQQTKPKNWRFHIMMTSALIIAFVVVPLGFMFSDQFGKWLQAMGVRTLENFAGGAPVAIFSGSWRDGGAVSAQTFPALALQSLALKKVKFHPLSGVGIGSRLNFEFEFLGKLPNPLDSRLLFSQTLLHIYLKIPGIKSDPAASTKAARVEFAGPGWDYQILVHGLHSQAEIFNHCGERWAESAEFTVRYVTAENADEKKPPAIEKTCLTVDFPVDRLGAVPAGDWHVYVLIGIMDSRNPTLLAEEAGLPSPFRTWIPSPPSTTAPGVSGRPVLYPLTVRPGAW